TSAAAFGEELQIAMRHALDRTSHVEPTPDQKFPLPLAITVLIFILLIAPAVILTDDGQISASLAVRSATTWLYICCTLFAGAFVIGGDESEMQLRGRVLFPLLLVG